MDAYIIEKTIDLGNGLGMPIYQVDYCAVYGNGYDSGSIWRTFGLYEHKEVAEYVMQGINNGDIQPVRKA